MTNSKNEPVGKGMENIESALSQTEHYIEQNQKSLIVIVLAIVFLVAAFFGYKRFLVAPKEVEAQKSVYMAERFFEQDSFRLALDGDGMNAGFIEIIDNYGITKTANLCCYYAGISNLKIGNYEDAIKYLKKFDSNDKLVAPIAMGAIGDANLELGNDKDAASAYVKAAKMSANTFTSPIFYMKAGQVLEKTGDYAQAIKLYKKIKTDYPSSQEGTQIDKFITRAELMLGKK
jgi:tetratricopeptide (TPR) repeat protein